MATQIASTSLFTFFDGSGDAPPSANRRSRTRRSFAAAEHIWWAGDRAEHVTFIERGYVQLVRPVAAGETSVLGIFGPGDTIGLVAALEGTAFPADAVVTSSSADVVRVPTAELRQIMATDPAITEAIHHALIAHTRVMMMKVSIVSAGSVAARLATLFVDLADRFGSNDPVNGRTTIDVMLPRATLAAFVDARVETVIRTLSPWRTSGVVQTTREGFDIDRAVLAEVALGG